MLPTFDNVEHTNDVYSNLFFEPITQSQLCGDSVQNDM